MYLICLSGAVLVFHAELEGWEQADAPRVVSTRAAARWPDRKEQRLHKRLGQVS